MPNFAEKLNDMKKQYLYTIAAAAISLCAAGCGTKSTAQGAANEFEAATVAYDSVSHGNIECKISVAYPQGDDSLAAGIKAFIARELADLYLPHCDDEASLSGKYPLYNGDGDKQAVAFYGDGTMRYLEELREEWKSSLAPGSDLPPMSQHVTMNVTETTPTYITYGITSDSYLGGAHHSLASYCRNISRETYKPVDDIISADKLKAIQPLLRKNVLRCLTASGVENVTDSTLSDYIILPDDGIIPLPAHSPWIERDSVKFAYQQYEIASYAVGAITFSVAAKDITHCLTPEAKALLKR